MAPEEEREAQEIQEIKDSIAKIELGIESIKTSFSTVLYGEGNPTGLGLVGRVVAIEKWIIDQKWFQRLVVAAIVGQIVTIGVLVITLVIRYLPQIP